MAPRTWADWPPSFRLLDYRCRCVAYEEQDLSEVKLAVESGSHGAFGSYVFAAAALSLYATQTGGVLGLTLDLQAKDVGEIAQLLRDTAFRKSRAAIAGTSLASHGRRLSKVDPLDSMAPTLGQVYQVILFRRFEDFVGLENAYDEGQRPAEEDWKKAQRTANYLTAKNPTRSVRLTLVVCSIHLKPTLVKGCCVL